MVWAYDSPEWLEILSASRDKKDLHSSPIPPFVPNTNGVNEPFSTSYYCFEFQRCFSCILEVTITEFVITN